MEKEMLVDAIMKYDAPMRAVAVHIVEECKYDRMTEGECIDLVVSALSAYYHKGKQEEKERIVTA